MLSLSGKQWQLRNVTQCTSGDQVVDLLRSLRNLQAEGEHTDLHLSTDAIKAAERIWQAIETKEQVYIFGDYDCDGVTSLAQLLRFFLRHGVSPIAHAPHRVNEGYGLQMTTVQKILQSNATLLITVDTGISSAAEVEHLQGSGVDVIVTDHHHVPQQIPPAFAVLHPEYSLQQTEWKPAGAGVVYNLLLALEKQQNWHGKAYDQMLAMIGTVGDIVPLTYANRTLVQQGLHALRTLPMSPLHHLCSALELDPAQVTSTDVAFRIVPHINAAGRLSDPTIALKVLMGEVEYIEQLLQLNTERKQAVEEALKAVEQHQSSPEALPHLVAYSSAELHHGILGLLAGKMTEHMGIPSIIATNNADGTMSASLRSPASYNIVEGLTRNAQYLERFGGHSQAAGCTFKTSNAQALFKALHQDILQTVDVGELVPTITADAEIEPNIITIDWIRALQTLEPYGCQNEQPIFVLKNVQLQNQRWIGAKEQHIQAMIGSTRVIGFSAQYVKNHEADVLDIVVKPRLTNWQGKEYAELQLMDARLAGG